MTRQHFNEYFVCPFCLSICSSEVCKECSSHENFKVSVMKAKTKAKLYFAFHGMFEGGGVTPEDAIADLICKPGFQHTY